MEDVAWNTFTLDTPRDARVSKNFVLRELVRSETAQRHDLDNFFPSETELQAAVYLCREVMQRVREQFGRPFTPNSVYRSQALERVLKRKPDDWISRSQHTKGQACDIEIPGLSNLALATWVKENLTFDQLILECYNPRLGANSGWVHISLKPPGFGDNRGEILSYIKRRVGRGYEYVQGLTTDWT